MEKMKKNVQESNFFKDIDFKLITKKICPSGLARKETKNYIRLFHSYSLVPKSAMK